MSKVTKGHFTFLGKQYWYETGLTDAEHGDVERWVKVYRKKELVFQMQDQMNVETMLRSWKIGQIQEILENVIEEAEETIHGPVVPEGDIDHDDEDRRAYNEELNRQLRRPSEY